MEWSLLPSPLGSVFTFIGILLLLLVMLTWLLTLIFALIATIKAISGTAWKYPLAREFVERYT